MTDQKMQQLLDRLIRATHELDRYFDEDATAPIPGSPATPEELTALANTGRAMPPSYRQLLGICNGMTNFWLDVPLLSTQDIINDTPGLKSFEEPFPDLWQSIFVAGTESYDALALDPAELQPDGEMAVVALSDEGEDERWPSLEAFLRDYVARVEAERDSERADHEELPE